MQMIHKYSFEGFAVHRQSLTVPSLKEHVEMLIVFERTLCVYSQFALISRTMYSNR